MLTISPNIELKRSLCCRICYHIVDYFQISGDEILHCENDPVYRNGGQRQNRRDWIQSLSPRIMASPVSRPFLINNFVLISVHEEQKEACNSKEDDIHDAKSKAGLQHRTCLVGIQRKGIAAADTVCADSQ